jgi:hypothetical protein
MSNSSIDVKLGSSLSLRHEVKLDGVAVNLTGWTFSARIEQNGEVIDNFTITPIDLALGVINLAVADTSDWPLGTLVFDVKYITNTAEVHYSPTLYLTCYERITP